jgi:hypothetical protein
MHGCPFIFVGSIVIRSKFVIAIHPILKVKRPRSRLRIVPRSVPLCSTWLIAISWRLEAEGMRSRFHTAIHVVRLCLGSCIYDRRVVAIPLGQLLRASCPSDARGMNRHRRVSRIGTFARWLRSLPLMELARCTSGGNSSSPLLLRLRWASMQSLFRFSSSLVDRNGPSDSNGGRILRKPFDGIVPSVFSSNLLDIAGRQSLRASSIGTSFQVPPDLRLFSFGRGYFPAVSVSA